MLDNVDKVNWEELLNGDDPSLVPDMPRILRNLASVDDNLRQGAEYGLTELVHEHPKLVLPVLPFLFELAATSHPVAKVTAVRLLVALLVDVAGPIGRDDDGQLSLASHSDLSEAIRRELNPVHRLCHEALASSDPKLRATAANGLAVFKDHADVPTLLRHVARETDPQVIVRLLKAIQILSPNDALSIALNHINDADPLIQMYAAVTVCELSSLTVSQQALDVLVSLVLRSWPTDWITHNTVDNVKKLGTQAFEYAMDKWVTALSNPPGDVTEYATFLLQAVFPRNPLSPPTVSAESLTLTQRSVASGIVHQPDLWLPSGTSQHSAFSENLRASGLPVSRNELAGLLAN